MIRGVLNDRLEPMVVVDVLNGEGASLSVEAVLDTGFNDYLTLPPDAVARLGLKYVHRITLTLAGGEDLETPVYAGFADWFGRMKEVNVIAAEGQPLLGMRLLRGCKIAIRVQPGGEALIEEDGEF